MRKLLNHNLPEPIREYRFNKKRKWKLDFAWPQIKLGVEVEGGTWIGGRHTQAKGFSLDCIKYNDAAANGWIILRFTSDLLNDDYPINLIEKFINDKKELGFNADNQQYNIPM